MTCLSLLLAGELAVLAWCLATKTRGTLHQSLLVLGVDSRQGVNWKPECDRRSEQERPPCAARHACPESNFSSQGRMDQTCPECHSEWHKGVLMAMDQLSGSRHQLWAVLSS